MAEAFTDAELVDAELKSRLSPSTYDLVCKWRNEAERWPSVWARRTRLFACGCSSTRIEVYRLREDLALCPAHQSPLVSASEHKEYGQGGPR